MDEKIHLTLEYERDVSLIIEELWARGLMTLVAKRLGKTAPCAPFVINYVDTESLQIWEHKKAFNWLKDSLLEENKKGTDFIKNIISEYKDLLSKIEKFWGKGPIKDKLALKRYLKLTEDAASLFSIWYYTGIDERTPKNVNSLVVALREKDEFFARSGMFVKSCILNLGGERDLVNFIFPEEFPNFPSNDILKTRASGVVSIDGKDHFFMPISQFAYEHSEYGFMGLNADVSKTEGLKGNVAYAGKARGLVRIVKNQRQMEKVELGEVIVSPMTTPDFMPAMKRAAAFITDEGGITCHAAIVARELRKPCITGTKIATHILKDGDFVEVDANIGVIKVIK